jgi:Holliday junction resolvase RusA-like endonuclease
MESAARNESLGPDEMPQFTSPVRITITHTRNRLADMDNLSGKAVLDGCVAAGILADDTAQQVTEIRTRQIKGDPERTEIEIEEIR